jgi:hypothetical protein
VVLAHEIIHDAIKNTDKGIVLNVDYEKAYDWVEWQILAETISTRGFDSR